MSRRGGARTYEKSRLVPIFGRGHRATLPCPLGRPYFEKVPNTK